MEIGDPGAANWENAPKEIEFKPERFLTAKAPEFNPKFVIQQFDIPKEDKEWEENFVMDMLARDGWKNREIAEYISQKYRYITEDAVKKRLQRRKTRKK